LDTDEVFQFEELPQKPPAGFFQDTIAVEVVKGVGVAYPSLWDL